MIISIRGTNGSGKSYIVHQILSECCHIKVEIRYPGREKPTGYICKTRSGSALFVPGHYEIANGGVDTLPSLDKAYELIKVHALELGCDVLYEGKNMSDGPKRLIELCDFGVDVKVALIDHPVKDCVKSVRARGHKIKVETIEKLARKCAREIEAFNAADVEYHVGSRETTMRKVREWLKLSS
jgi:hypothetical protein